MEYGSIEREIHVDASPEVVFEVVSSPEHLKEWWPDEAEIEPAAGATGRIVFHRAAPEEALVVPIMVVDAQPPRRAVEVDPRPDQVRAGEPPQVPGDATRATRPGQPGRYCCVR